MKTVIYTMLMAIGINLIFSTGVVKAQVTVTVNAMQRHQTWEGWEVAINNYHRDENALKDLDQHPVPQDILGQILDDAVDNLGATAIRMQAVIMFSRNRPGLEPVNDNNDPFVLNSSKFRWHWFDPYVRCIVIPFKNRVEAQGNQFSLNLHAVCSRNSWHWHEPASDPGQEYAEFMMACLDHLKNNYGIIPEYLTICNEPSNSGESQDVIIRGMKKLAVRMQSAGYIKTKLRFPDDVSVSNSLSYIDRLIATEAGLLPQIGQFSFHGYGGFNTSTLNNIRFRAQTYNKTTAQTEWWFTSNHPPDIFKCMTEADVVLYQPYVLSGPSNEPSEGGLYGITYSGGTYPLYNYTGYIRKNDWYDIYHYSAFIQPGDVRIEVISQNSEIKPVAFEKPDGRQTVVVINSASSARDISINSLSSGTYGIVVTSSSQKGVEQMPVTIGLAQSLNFTLPANSLATFYQATASQPSPGIMQFSATNYRVNENGGIVTISVTRTSGSSGTVTVDYTTNDGSALAGLDYTATSGTLTFSDGETSKSFTIQILDDTLDEVDETVNLTLNNPTGGVNLGSIITAALTIIDDERATQNLLVDPGFENNGQGWQRSGFSHRPIVTSPVHSGTKSQEIGKPGTSPRVVYQDVAITGGNDYYAAGRVQTNNVIGRISLLWLDAMGVGEVSTPNLLRIDTIGEVTGTQGWTTVSGQYSAPGNAVAVRFQLEVEAPSSSGKAWFDDNELFRVGQLLSVEQVSLTAAVSNNSVELTWKTASKSNNLGFQVERSQDRRHFTKIKFVAGQVTTAISHLYSFVDKNLLSGTYYYRLKQIDSDGRFEYSSIVEVIIDLPRKFMLYQNYPNPFNTATTIEYQLPQRSRVKLVILNLLGEEVTTLVDTIQCPGVYQVQWEDTSGLNSGLYWYKIEAGDYIQTRKVLFLK